MIHLEVFCCVTLIWLTSSPTLLKRDMKDFTSTDQTYLPDSWHKSYFIMKGQVLTLRRLVPEENFFPLSQSEWVNAKNFTQNLVKTYVWKHEHLHPHIRRCRNDVSLAAPHRPCTVALNETSHVTSPRPSCIHTPFPMRFKWLSAYGARTCSS
jgi:hypothetical protein